MTNYEWLLQMDGAARKSWFDAEHVETANGTLDGDTAPENADSRERLEADIEEWAAVMNLEGYQLDMIHGWLNRRAAILEREMVKFNRRYFDCVEQEKKIAELTRKMGILKAHGVEIVDAVAGGYEVYNEKIREVSELQAQVDELTAERDKLEENLDAAYAKNRSLRQHISQMQNGRSEWHVKAVRLEKQLEVTNKRCEEYRNKFGKCLDYADAIHALMDDEGIA